GVAIDATSLYIVGASGTTPIWRIEKRSLSDGSITTAFGTSGVVTGNTNAVPRGIAIDSSNMYVVGEDDAAQLGGAWRIEMRSLTDGSSAYAIAGSSTSAVARAVAIDSTYLYVVGDGQSVFRMEKRSLSSGAGDTTFGSGGIATS